MRKFSITGSAKLGSQWRDFKKEITAETEDNAKELLIKIYGGKHGLPRRFINIAEVAETTDHSVILDEKRPDTTEIPATADD